MKGDTYGPPRIRHFPNAVVEIYTPLLTEEERARRMEHVKRTAKEYLEAVWRHEREEARRARESAQTKK